MKCSTNKKITLCSHPVISHNLAIIRDKNTPSEIFRSSVQKIARILFYKATENLPEVSVTVETPLMKTQESMIAPDAEIIVAPILRAGLIFSDIASEILPQARIHHLGLYRDEKTLQPVSYYNNLPKYFNFPEKTYVYILDPMLATGGSAIAAIKLFADMNVPVSNITFISLIAAPEGIENINSQFENINTITASLDECLNSIGYILPGLGDAGDRTFNTVQPFG